LGSPLWLKYKVLAAKLEHPPLRVVRFSGVAFSEEHTASRNDLPGLQTHSALLIGPNSEAFGSKLHAITHRLAA